VYSSSDGSRLPFRWEQITFQTGASYLLHGSRLPFSREQIAFQASLKVLL